MVLRKSKAVAILLVGVVASIVPPVAGADAETQETRSYTIAADIAALRNYHRPAKEAGRRLVEQGEASVPALMQAVVSPIATPQQRAQIMNLLAEIGDSRATVPIVQAAREYIHEPNVTWLALAALSEMPVSDSAIDLAVSVANETRAQLFARRAALVYLGRKTVDRAREVARRFESDEEAHLRVAALYVAARLGDATVKAPILENLASPLPRSLIHGLLIALAEVSTSSELKTLVPIDMQQTDEFRSAVRYASWRLARGNEQIELAHEMLRSTFIYDRQIAAEFLYDKGGAEILKPFVGQHVPSEVRAVVVHKLRSEGYEAGTEGVQRKLRHEE